LDSNLASNWWDKSRISGNSVNPKDVQYRVWNRVRVEPTSGVDLWPVLKRVALRCRALQHTEFWCSAMQWNCTTRGCMCAHMYVCMYMWRVHKYASIQAVHTRMVCVFVCTYVYVCMRSCKRERVRAYECVTTWVYECSIGHSPSLSRDSAQHKQVFYCTTPSNSHTHTRTNTQKSTLCDDCYRQEQFTPGHLRTHDGSSRPTKNQDKPTYSIFAWPMLVGGNIYHQKELHDRMRHFWHVRLRWPWQGKIECLERHDYVTWVCVARAHFSAPPVQGKGGRHVWGQGHQNCQKNRWQGCGKPGRLKWTGWRAGGEWAALRW